MEDIKIMLSVPKGGCERIRELWSGATRICAITDVSDERALDEVIGLSNSGEEAQNRDDDKDNGDGNVDDLKSAIRDAIDTLEAAL